MKLALIGHPLDHSRSKQIHDHWLDWFGHSGQYDVVDTKIDDLKDTVQRLREEGYAGFNVTLPHKSNILGLCDEIAPDVKEIGAANTVHIKDDRLCAYNTDTFGFTQNIKKNAPHFDWTAGSALVLGAGGAARSVVYALKKAGVSSINVCNRTYSKAVEIADDFDVYATEWENRNEMLVSTGFVINTTSLGMLNHPRLEIDWRFLQAETLVNDLVYNPPQTSFLAHARERGCKVVPGVDMLLFQAQKAFEIWTGQTPEITDALLKAVLAGVRTH